LVIDTANLGCGQTTIYGQNFTVSSIFYLFSFCVALMILDQNMQAKSGKKLTSKICQQLLISVPRFKIVPVHCAVNQEF